MLHASHGKYRRVPVSLSLALCVSVCVCVCVRGTRRYYRGNDRDNKGHKFFPLTRRPSTDPAPFIDSTLFLPFLAFLCFISLFLS